MIDLDTRHIANTRPKIYPSPLMTERLSIQASTGVPTISKDPATQLLVSSAESLRILPLTTERDEAIHHHLLRGI